MSWRRVSERKVARLQQCFVTTPVPLPPFSVDAISHSYRWSLLGSFEYFKLSTTAISYCLRTLEALWKFTGRKALIEGPCLFHSLCVLSYNKVPSGRLSGIARTVFATFFGFAAFRADTLVSIEYNLSTGRADATENVVTVPPWLWMLFDSDHR